MAELPGSSVTVVLRVLSAGVLGRRRKRFQNARWLPQASTLSLAVLIMVGAHVPPLARAVAVYTALPPLSWHPSRYFFIRPVWYSPATLIRWTWVMGFSNRLALPKEEHLVYDV